MTTFPNIFKKMDEVEIPDDGKDINDNSSSSNEHS